MAKYFSTKYHNGDIVLQNDNISKEKREKTYISYLNVFLIFTTIGFIREKYKTPTEKTQHMEKHHYSTIIQSGIQAGEGKLSKFMGELTKNFTINLQVVKTMNEEEVAHFLLEIFEELGHLGEENIYIDVKRNSFGIVTNIHIKGVKYKESIKYIQQKITNTNQLHME